MSDGQSVCILWDASHIWGLMAWRAVRALGLHCRLVKGQDIAEGGILGKSTKSARNEAALLLVPGGNARHKAQALGADGREAVRRWLAAGNFYLGFCGGAGLALTHPNAEDGLNICPWSRAPYPQRLYHLISGHVRARVTEGLTFSPEPLSCQSSDGLYALPVWWPGQFAPQEVTDVQILAVGQCPDRDFWLADLPLSKLPGNAIAHWQSLYGINVSADFLEGRPLVISGSYGLGRYVLSYSHLETPNSPDANAWLARLLSRMACLDPGERVVPLWQLRHPNNAWPRCRERLPLQDALRHMRDLLDLAVEHHLFFARTHWLWGWRTSMPGAGCNNLHAALCTALELEPTPAALTWWRSVCGRFAALEHIFAAGAEDHVLACRLAESLSPTLPGAVDRRWLEHQRASLFGHPMYGGGILEELLGMIEEVIYLAQDHAQPL
ncbi:MAG: hypothetical protein J5861_01835 [Desulfovibrio sp.]|nr:hypothetical protein [Desulfovibrio sp.]